MYQDDKKVAACTRGLQRDKPLVKKAIGVEDWRISDWGWKMVSKEIKK